VDERPSYGYRRITALETAMRLLPGWFEDYNTVHPHSGLRFLSPRGVPRSECLTHPAPCPVKRGALQAWRTPPASKIL